MATFPYCLRRRWRSYVSCGPVSRTWPVSQRNTFSTTTTTNFFGNVSTMPTCGSLRNEIYSIRGKNSFVPENITRIVKLDVFWPSTFFLFPGLSDWSLCCFIVALSCCLLSPPLLTEKSGEKGAGWVCVASHFPHLIDYLGGWGRHSSLSGSFLRSEEVTLRPLL